MVQAFYQNIVLKYPKLVLFLVLLSVGVLGIQAKNLEVDASAETLLLEDDKDLAFTREVNDRYGSSDFLVIAFTPKEYLLSDSVLGAIRGLTKELEALPMTKSVTSIINVPLLESPPKPVKELLKEVPTLETPWIDRKLAEKEFLSSPVYENMLVSPSFKTTIIQVILKTDKTYFELLKKRNSFRDKKKTEGLTTDEELAFAQVLAEFKAHRDKARILEGQNIDTIRAIMDKYRSHGDMFLGGASMIAYDIVNYIKNDLGFFGIGVISFLALTLFYIFRQVRWVLIPLLTCAASVVATAGFLGLFSWEVTVISSNFISLQIIITMALTIHLMVKYRELEELHPDKTQEQLVLESTVAMAEPCAFMVLTTVAGFCSLLLSGILPVINFGWMMTAGITVSLGLTFLIFPTVLVQMGKIHADRTFESKFTVTKKLADYTENHGGKILIVSFLTAVFCITGASRLLVENSFIDYFKESTEIHQGMKVIDQQLGGTTPLDVVIDLEEMKTVESNVEAVATASSAEADADFDDFEEEFEATKNEAQYWFTSEKMAKIEAIHDYLDAFPETGKVISLGTMLKVGKTLNGGDPLDNFALALIYNELPQEFKDILLTPYVSVENNQVRFSIRVRDSEPNLRRNELLKRIQAGLENDLKIPPKQIHLASLLVLYNNMLQSLFNSQILTLGAVIVVLMIMFLILFRSFKIALIAMFPNLLSVGFVLGLMGWLKIPLDMMTITIAAISVGIAVDDTIHYIHRYAHEFEIDRDYVAAMHRCHESIGYAMYYTSVTIIAGFSILMVSNFIPSIYFGLLTGIAMVVALVTALTLLPQLMIYTRPFGPGAK
ncbi:MAG: MMPL family transporter [SAR324 cluster bacterium]|nr:MMPL family transporter [SAR324 cluster bacterium]